MNCIVFDFFLGLLKMQKLRQVSNVFYKKRVVEAGKVEPENQGR